jgi:glutathione synthase/RimK-type ligase-like ATP-grasp enzyme
MFVYTYKKGSKSAKSLAKALNVKCLTRPKRSRRGYVINWGNSKADRTPNPVVNNFMAVSKASNKLLSFEVFKEKNISCPDFTTDIEEAKDWIEDGDIVVCRKLLRSHSGKGIVIAETIDQLVAAPLYVKYFKKSSEFRVHVFNGKVIDAVKKKKRNGVTEGYNKWIRVHGNGWVFCRDGIVISETMSKLAIDAVNALGLTFGAVDIVAKTSGEMVCLEVNTAPALEGTTLISYTKAIKEYVNV